MERLMIVGCGGIGGVVASGLVKNGRHVLGVTGNPEISEAIRQNGLTLKGEGNTRFDVVAGLDEGVKPSSYDAVFLATPPNRAEKAAQDALPFLKAGAPIVCFQNGLMEERLEQSIHEHPVIGGIVAFGASMLAPGVVERTSNGGFVVGALHGHVDPHVNYISNILKGVSSVERTQNLRGARWSKLAINCVISTLGTVGGDRLGALMRHRFVRRLGLEIASEVTAVAKSEGIDLEKVSGTLDLDWLALSNDERMIAASPGLIAKHTVLLAVGAKYRRLRSSMLSAIERGREAPIDYLNGEVVERGLKSNIPTPINAGLVEEVRRLGPDEKPSLARLNAFFEKSRKELRALNLAA